MASTPSVELKSSRRREPKRLSLLDANEKIAAWAESKTPWHAAEILETVAFIGRTKASDEAAELLGPYRGRLASGVESLLAGYLNEDLGGSNDELPQNQEKAHRRAIAKLRAARAI